LKWEKTLGFIAFSAKKNPPRKGGKQEKPAQKTGVF
jgi:hypothetical protein